MRNALLLVIAMFLVTQALAAENTTSSHAPTSQDEQQALGKRARDGDLNAQSELCQTYDLYPNGNWYCMRAAERGDEKALEKLQRGNTKPKSEADCTGSLYWMKQAKPRDDAQAALGNPHIQQQIGWSYYFGGGCSLTGQSYTEAYFWWKLSVREGERIPGDDIDMHFWISDAAKHLSAEQLSAVNKRIGDWKPAPSRDLTSLITKSNQGDVTATVQLWKLYETGADDLAADRWEELKYLHKAAEQGDATAQREFAFHYWNGNGVEKDENEALSWYLKAAGQRDRDAQEALGMLYREKKDYAEAYFWFSWASSEKSGSELNAKALRDEAEAKLTDDQKARAAKRLQETLNPAEQAKLAADDAAVAQARNAADQKIAQLKTKAEQGDLQSMVGIGDVYEKGEGIRKDDVEAMNWYRKAADLGYAPAELTVGGLYWSGMGVNRDLLEALKWERKAADQGYIPALKAVGYAFERGDGVSADRDEAIRWYRNAADRGDQESQWKLGHLYENPSGKEKNWPEAYFWYCASAAYNWSTLAADHLTAEEKAKDEGRLRDWRLAHGPPFIPSWAAQFSPCPGDALEPTASKIDHGEPLATPGKRWPKGKTVIDDDSRL